MGFVSTALLASLSLFIGMLFAIELGRRLGVLGVHD